MNKVEEFWNASLVFDTKKRISNGVTAIASKKGHTDAFQIIALD